jgi:ribosome-binding factor A
MPGRMPKVNELMRQELSRLIHKKLGGEVGLITVTDVETTSDLQLATVHVSIFEADTEEAWKTLQSHAPFFQAELGRKLTMKFIPKLTFKVNDEARRERVEELLEQLP